MYNIMVSTQRPLVGGGALKKGARNFPTLGFSHIIFIILRSTSGTSGCKLFYTTTLVLVTLGMHNTS